MVNPPKPVQTKRGFVIRVISVFFLVLGLQMPLTASVASGKSCENLFHRTYDLIELQRLKDDGWYHYFRFPEGQRDIIFAQDKGVGLRYVEILDARVVGILPDTKHRQRHQRWIVKLANGQTVIAVYNLEIAKRVPVRIGDIVSLGGEYNWNQKGGVIHWLHGDPKSRRPDGYVHINGSFYGEVFPRILKSRQARKD